MTLTIRMAGIFLKTSRIPRNGEEIKLLYTRRCWHLPDHENAFAAVLKFAAHYAFRQGYSFLTVAVHQKDALGRVLQKMHSFPYEAQGMVCGLQDQRQAEKIAAGTVLHDFSII